MFAIRADIRRRTGSYCKAAIAAFPECQSAFRAYISFKSAISRITTMSTHKFVIFICHIFSSFVDIDNL
jgi:hypothetical protein